MSDFFDRATNWIVRYLPLTAGLIAVISLIAIVGYYDRDLVTQFLNETDTETKSFQERAREDLASPLSGFSLEAEAVIVVQTDQIFSPTGAKAMRAIVAELEDQDFVRDVIWLDEIPMLNVFSMPQPVLPYESASQKRFELSKDKALKHPFIKGQLLSADCKTALLLVNFDRFFVQDNTYISEGIKSIAETVAKQHPAFEAEFTVTGRLPVWVTARESHESNTFYYQLVGYSMITVMSVILFRGLAAVFVVAIAPAMGVFWTLGFIRFLEYENNPFNDVVLPVLVSLIALTDGVHLMVEIRRLRASGLQPREAAGAGIRKVGLACALTSLTTAIGFGSLALANHELVQQFGVSCVIGVLLSFIAVITCIPLACCSWLGKFVQVGQQKSLVEHNLNRIGVIVDLVLKRKTVVALIGIVSTITFILISLGLRPDERQSSIIPASSEASIGIKKIDKAMNGVENSQVNVRWDEPVAGDSLEVVQVVRKIDNVLGSEELIGHPLSILKLIDSMPGGGNAEDRISMVELLPPSLKRVFYTPERKEAMVSFRVQDLGIASYDPVFRRIQLGLDEIMAEHPAFNLELDGDAVWRWENLFQIVVDLAASLGTAVLIIFFVLAMAFRSLRIGLISLVPNLFPLAVSGVFLYVTGQALEVVTVCAFTVCLGIAVDDTIHFLTRYQEELKTTNDEQQAIHNAFTGVGTALIMTTIVLVSGFATVLFSDSRDHFIFASMGMITLSAALFADLVFLPALLARFSGKNQKAVHH